MNADKFTQKTIETIQTAQSMAQENGNQYLTPEHLLYALVDADGGLIGTLLGRMGVDCNAVLSELDTAIDQLPKVSGGSGEVYASPETSKIFNFAEREAKSGGDAYVSVEHLMLGIFANETAAIKRIFSAHGITKAGFVAELKKVKTAPVTSDNPEDTYDALKKYGTDLVERAREGKMDPVIGRDQEIRNVIRILSRKTKNNPVLIGEPGVGKTAIVEGVAQYLAAGTVPEPLRGKRLYALDMASVIAGTKYRGEFEERVRDILAEVRRVQNVILFVDEMHTLVGAGAAEGAIDAANLLKPALGRGELQLIGATTLREYRSSIEKDAALERRFRAVQVREPTPEETREILAGLCPGLEAHHHVSIPQEAVSAAVELSCRYLTDKFLPDKAVDLLDEGAACARMRQLGSRTPEEEQALQAAVRAGKYERAAALRDRLRRRGQPGRTVSVQDIAAAVSSRTGIPVGTISRTERQRLRTLEQTLSARVIGQEEAVHAAAEAVRRGRSGLAEQKRPAAAMLFLGPTGVGKTELCKALAEAVYGSEDAMIRVDMSEYMEKFTVSRLIGAPPGYIGHDEGGELSERVRRRPYSLVLFDELEKAHPDVCGLLLQVMEDGFLTDSGGRRIDFRNTMLVMTSNLGVRGGGGLGFGAQAEDGALRSLREHFSPEFLGRIDCVARFQPLDAAALEQIAQQQLTALQQRAERLHVRLELPDGLARSFALRSRDGRGGAREIRRLVRHEMEAPLAALLLGARAPERVRVDLRDDRPVFPVS